MSDASAACTIKGDGSASGISIHLDLKSAGCNAAGTGNMHYIGKNLLGQSRDITCGLLGFQSVGKAGWPDFVPSYSAHFSCRTLFQGKMKVSVQTKTSSFPGNVMIEKASGLDIMAPANTNTNPLTITGAPWPY